MHVLDPVPTIKGLPVVSKILHVAHVKFPFGIDIPAELMYAYSVPLTSKEYLAPGPAL